MVEIVVQSFGWHLAMLLAVERVDSMEFELVLESERLALQNQEYALAVDDATNLIEVFYNNRGLISKDYNEKKSIDSDIFFSFRINSKSKN